MNCIHFSWQILKYANQCETATYTLLWIDGFNKKDMLFFFFFAFAQVSAELEMQSYLHSVPEATAWLGGQMADAVVLNQTQKDCVVEKHEIDSNSLLYIKWNFCLSP